MRLSLYLHCKILSEIKSNCIPVQSPGTREKFKLQDSASALSPETAWVWEQHSLKNQLQQPDAAGGRVTLEKRSQRCSAEEMGG